MMQVHGFLRYADVGMSRCFSFQFLSNVVGSLLRSCAMTASSSGKMELRRSSSLGSAPRHNSSRPPSVSRYDDKQRTLIKAK